AQVPFPGGTALEKLVRHGSEAPTPVAQLRADVPPEVSAIVGRLLAKKPEQRLQTPAELAAELEPFAEVAQVAPAAGGAGDSPWAGLLDDERRALATTLPANFALTPASSMDFALGPATLPPLPAWYHARWVQVALIAAAAAVGFMV